MRVFERMTASMASGVTVPAAEKGSIVKDTPAAGTDIKDGARNYAPSR